MRRISENQIQKKVYEATLKANFVLRSDILQALKGAYKKETNKIAKNMLSILIENARIAKGQRLAICQDTGMVVVFCKIGKDAQVIGDINKAINNAVKKAYKKGFLRKSVVSSPFTRKNTNTNTPCIIHYDIVSGDKIKIAVMPKGFGSENSSFVKMFNPTAPVDKVIEFIVNATSQVAVDACPPLILGIGIGGTMDKACLLAKEALLGKIRNPKYEARKTIIYKMEKYILERLNKSNIGPMGLGGKATCLGVNILTYPTHIAGLPVCVNVSCHALRSASAVV